MTRRRDKHLSDLWKLGLFLYLVAFNYPLLEVFNHEGPLLGIPLVLFFLFGAWLLSIFLILLFVRRLRSREDSGQDDREQGEAE